MAERCWPGGVSGKERGTPETDMDRGLFFTKQERGSHLLSAALGGGQAGRPSVPRGLFSASLYTTWKTGTAGAGAALLVQGHETLPLAGSQLGSTHKPLLNGGRMGALRVHSACEQTISMATSELRDQKHL